MSFSELNEGEKMAKHCNDIIKQRKIEELETEMKDYKEVTELSIGEHAKIMAKILESISCLEDKKMEQSKVLSGIDSEVKDFENKISSLKAKKVSIETTSRVLDNQIKESDKKKRTIEYNFKMWHSKRKMESDARGKKVKLLKGELKDSGSNQMQFQNDQLQVKEDGSNAGKLKSLDFLTRLINRYTNNLECPICLNTAEIPIYQCKDSHLVCSKCRPKVEKCPECRISYKEEYKRHRSGLNLDFFQKRNLGGY